MAKSGAKWSKKTTKWMEGFVIGTLCNYHKQKHTNISGQNHTIYTVRCFISVDINYDGTYFPR